MPAPTARYYVYALLRPNGKPFYVGKGTGQRMYSHRREANRGHRCHKCNVIRKILRSGGRIGYMYLWAGDDEEEAYEQEKYWIAFYGVETLTNGTHGGDGVRATEAVQEKMRQSWRRVRSTPSYRKQQGERSRSRWGDPEYRERMTAISRERTKRPGWSEAISERNRRLWQDPEYRAKQAARRRERPRPEPKPAKPRSTPLSEEEKRRHRQEGVKKRQESPTWRENLRKRAVERAKRPDWSEKMRQAALKRWRKERGEEE